VTIYLFYDEIYGTILDNRTIVLGKSLSGLRGYLQVRRGNRPSVDVKARFSSYSPAAGQCLVVAFAEGINRAAGLPVQARVLQLTEGMTIQIGENSENALLNVSLTTDSPQTANQVQQVLQGILALLTLTQAHPDLDVLVRSLVFSIEDRTVRCDLNYPLELATFWVRQLVIVSEAAMGTTSGKVPAVDQEDAAH